MKSTTLVGITEGNFEVASIYSTFVQWKVDQKSSRLQTGTNESPHEH